MSTITKISWEKILRSKIKDYSFVIGFFLVFSFFIVFAIRPNIATVITLNKQLETLKKTDSAYENIILHIVDLQTVLEKNRDDFILLDQALPSRPQVNKVVDDVKNSATASGILIKRLDISEVSLKEDSNKKNVKSYAVNIETNSNYEQSKSFIDMLLKQRRLKSINTISIQRGDETETQVSSKSGALIMKLEISGYYL
ncbi:type 4a pilus biogenesis protein PilO [Candidatus Roizmanbacteria bacterium]|nr:type 4a pilus biogenesis protein PilO [Candidatus Roizmanbacteria bacterium]